MLRDQEIFSMIEREHERQQHGRCDFLQLFVRRDIRDGNHDNAQQDKRDSPGELHGETAMLCFLLLWGVKVLDKRVRFCK